MQVVSVNVGKPATVDFKGKDVKTGIFKQPVDGAVYVDKRNFVGDAQADLINHGGPDKPVCVYPFDHYPYWERQLSRKLAYAAFGENLTVSGMLEEDVAIGDVYRIGGAVMQVSQPRYPCFKLAVKHGVADLPEQVLTTQYTGWYFRVLEEGNVQAGDSIECVEKHPLHVSVAFATRTIHLGKKDKASILKLLSVQELAASWQDTMTNLLGKLGGEATDEA